MKAKLMLLGVAAAVALTGCAGVPQAPKDEAELIAMGKDNLLHVPVDISQFNAHKMMITSRLDPETGWGVEGKTGQITVFTDPATGKTYDLDGQPINEEGYRVLNDGHVCVVTAISGKTRSYGKIPFFYFDERQEACRTTRHSKNMNQKRAIMAAGTAAVATGGLAGLAVFPTSLAIDQLTEDDLL